MADYTPIALKLAPGIVAADSAYAMKGRYVDGNNVRFYRGFPERIGGWSRLVQDKLDGPARGAHVWSDLTGQKYMAWGTANKLWLLKDTTLYDITPLGMPAGNVDAMPNTLVAGGWGTGGWGTGGWGGANEVLRSTVPPRQWILGNWGQDLVAAYRGGPLYMWTVAGGPGTRAAQIGGQAPAVVSDFFVSETNRYLVALGATGGGIAGGGDPMTVAWCDRENITVWTPTVTNTAGDKRLEIGTEIITSIDSRSGQLILTDAAAYIMRFIGPPYIWSITKAAEGHDPPVGQNAVISRDGIAYWIGYNAMTMFDGTIKQMDCDVRNVLYDNLDKVQAAKVYGGHIKRFGELVWLYPDLRDGTKENSRYIAFNQDGWSLGTMARTSWIDENLLTNNPVATAPDGTIYQHEIQGVDADGAALPWLLETGEIELGDGGQFMRTRKLIPDYQRIRGSHTVTILDRRYPQEGADVRTPVTMTPGLGRLSVRSRDRSIRMRWESNTLDNDFRMGVYRATVRGDGARG